MSEPINDLIEAVWEAHGDSEEWVKLANEASAENEALHNMVTAAEQMADHWQEALAQERIPVPNPGD